MIMNSSRQSIVPILVSMLVTCVAGLFFIAEIQIDNTAAISRRKNCLMRL